MRGTQCNQGVPPGHTLFDIEQNYRAAFAPPGLPIFIWILAKAGV